MIVLGLILLILGWVLGIGILVTIGIIVLVIGVVFLILGQTGRAVGGLSIGTEGLPGWRQALTPTAGVSGSGSRGRRAAVFPREDRTDVRQGSEARPLMPD
jgi:hypothetical protein